MADPVILGVTKGGKQIACQNYGNRNILRLYFVGGGELPELLQGAFSDRTTAMARVGKYLANEPEPKPARKPRAARRTPRGEK